VVHPEDGERSGSPDIPSDRQARTEAQFGGGYRELLAIAAFRRLWLVQSVAALGEALALVAMPLLAYDITGSEEIVGLIFVVQFVPRILLAPVTGVLADRVDRRRLMLAADLGRVVLVSFLPFTTAAWQIAVLAGLTSIANAVSRPAEMAALPAVVGSSLLVRALSMSQVTNSLVRIIGPAIGAGLVGAFGPRPAFLVQAICFLISGGLLWSLRLPAVERVVSTAGFLATVGRDAWEGLRVVATNRIVRGIAATEALWAINSAALVVTMVVYLETSLDLGDASGRTYALLLAIASAGAALGALTAGRVERRIGRSLLMAIGYLAPLLVIPAAFTPPLWVLVGFWFALGFADAWAVIGMQAYLAEAVEDSMRGRVYSIWGAVIYLGASVAYAAIGWVTPRLGPPATMALAGAMVGLGGPLVLFATGAIAAMRQAASPESPDRPV